MRQAGGSVATYLSRTAKKYPNNPALISGAESPKFPTISFAELDQQVNQAAHELKGAGICAGDKTLLFVNPGSSLIIWAFALFRLGAIPVVIDPGMGIKSFLSCIKRTKPTAMVGICRAFWLRWLLPRAFRTVHKHFLVRNEAYGTELSTTNPVENFQGKPDSLAAIVFTSGSTGAPKGVRYLHQTFDAQIECLRSVFGMQAGEVDLTTLPIFGLFNPALGITSVLPEIDPRKPASAVPEKLVYSLTAHDVTTAFASPVIGKKVASACSASGNKLDKMNRFFLAGAPVPPDLVQDLVKALPNGRVIVPYGATEALPVSWTDGFSILKAKQSTLQGGGSLIGQPVPGADVKILPNCNPPLPDYPSDHKTLEQAEVGEICVSGKMVSEGYDRMPGATCDARFKIGDAHFHRMGDLGYFDETGTLRFLGRKAECVYTHDGPIETERCEPAINQLLCVNKCALVGLGDSPNQEPCLVVEPNRSLVRERGEMALRKEILESCNSLFPKYKINRIFFEKKIPVDARHNAKIHRLTLSKKWTERVAKKATTGTLA